MFRGVIHHPQPTKIYRKGTKTEHEVFSSSLNPTGPSIAGNTLNTYSHNSTHTHTHTHTHTGFHDFRA